MDDKKRGKNYRGDSSTYFVHTEDEVEFLKAIQRYQKDTGKKFPTWSEVLEVVKSLGYRKDKTDE